MVERVSSLPKYYVCIRHACTVCMSLQKTDLCLYIYINSLYNIFTVIQYFFKLNSLSVMYTQIIKFDSWVPYAPV